MTFLGDVERGKLGEEWVLSHSAVCVDVRGWKYFQDLDIDFIMEGGLLVEVKTDYRCCNTGNIYYEKYTNSGRIGCCAKTRADAIWYYCVGMGVYKFRVSELRKESGRMTRDGRGMLLRLSDLVARGVCYEVVDI